MKMKLDACWRVALSRRKDQVEDLPKDLLALVDVRVLSHIVVGREGMSRWRKIGYFSPIELKHIPLCHYL